MKKLSDPKTRAIMKKFRIPFVKQFLTKTEEHAVLHAKKIGFPVVLKISSPDIIHKTDVGGVAIDIGNEEELRDAYRKMIRNVKRKKPRAKINGVVVQEMVPRDSRELIIGGRRDPQFGPVIMFGLGGVWVEALKDVSFRLIPIDRNDAKNMIKEIRGYSVLQGMRGQKPVNFKLLEDIMLKVSRMVWKDKKIQELDINPLFINDKKAIAVDSRIVV
ncbi:MAG: acetate--CoA ligase family protein [Candidatus Aenigmatarchaeota archaeon]|nr:MAG: acetate--CoA ligase family protein [Candidatus Aenigmarchaeota archaeon]